MAWRNQFESHCSSVSVGGYKLSNYGSNCEIGRQKRQLCTNHRWIMKVELVLNKSMDTTGGNDMITWCLVLGVLPLESWLLKQIVANQRPCSVHSSYYSFAPASGKAAKRWSDMILMPPWRCVIGIEGKTLTLQSQKEKSFHFHGSWVFLVQQHRPERVRRWQLTTVASS